MEVKGTAIAALPKFILGKFGHEKFVEWLASLSPEAREIYQNEILISKWYDLSIMYSEPTKQVCKVFFNGSQEGAWEAGRFDADFSLKGVYSMFVKLGSPSFIIKQASKIFSAYFRPSKLQMTESTDNSVVVKIIEFNEINNYIEQRIGGYMERALEINGCKEIIIKITKSVANGDANTEYNINWK